MAEKYPLVLNGTNIEELQSGDSIAGAIDSVSQDTSPNLGGNLNTGSYNVSFGDNAKAQFGDSNDLQIYHDGTHSRISDAGSGELRLMSNGDGIKLQNVNGENMVYALNNGAVNLYYDNSQKLATTSTGVSVTGNVTATSFTGDGSNLTGVSSVGGDTGVNFNDNVKAQFGAGNDLQIYHNGSNSYVSDQGTGNLFILGSNNVTIGDAAGYDFIQCVDEGSGGYVRLNHQGNAEKLRTTSTGVNVSGLSIANQQIFTPVARAYGVDNTGAVSGWKTIQWNSNNKQIGSSLFSNNDERITPGVAGWYFVTFNHGHNNGYHVNYYIKVVRSDGNNFMEVSGHGHRHSVSGFIYLDSAQYLYCQVYHDNSSHSCVNSLIASVQVWHLNGV